MSNTEEKYLTPRRDWRDEIAPLRGKIEKLQEEQEHFNKSYSGLQDLDTQFDLISTELRAVLTLVKRGDFSRTLEMRQAAREYALQALDLLEEITAAGVSLDQRQSLLKSEELKQARALLKEIVIFGGSDLFQAADTLGKKSKKIVKSVERSLFRFIRPVDASAEIEEGEEDVLISDHFLLPRSQAVLMIEEELLPQVEAELEEDPGNAKLQERIRMLEEQAEVLKKMRFFPRARPILMHENAGLHSDDFVQFNADGEMLVKMRLKTILGSGNKLDLLLENMKFHIVRDIAGTYRDGKSGQKRSSAHRVFRDLSYHFPFLRRLEQKDELRKLAELAKSGKREEVRRQLHNMMVHDRNLLWTSEPMELDEFE